MAPDAEPAPAILDGMADDEATPERESEEPAPLVDPPSRPAPRPRDDSEKAIGLEVARLFGMNPRQLVTKRPPRPEAEEPAERA